MNLVNELIQRAVPFITLCCVSQLFFMAMLLVSYGLLFSELAVAIYQGRPSFSYNVTSILYWNRLNSSSNVLPSSNVSSWSKSWRGLGGYALVRALCISFTRPVLQHKHVS